MCGIGGVWRSSDAARPVDAAAGAALRAALAHRGPDGEGEHRDADGRLLLVHRRLAVIDPGPASAQPMASPDGRWRLAWNGEIYNFREIRRGLEAEGEAFRTAGDTEVLLRLLAREGPDALPRLRGMFALALWDGEERSLLLARDRFGIKPLYLSVRGAEAVFASEIGALLGAGLVPRDPDPAGILSFLLWGSVLPPLTWIRGLEALLPGSWARFGPDGRSARGRFSDLRDAFRADPGAAPVAEGELRERFREALADSVRAHLVSDVPVGVFLSGGLDSTALAALAREASPGEVRTFTVGFAEEAYDESAAAAAAARALGAAHREIRAGARDLERDLPGILARMDQPTVDGVNSWFVAKAVAGDGVKVALSGAGADEVLGGYPSFRRVPRAARWGRAAPRLARAAGASLGRLLPAWKREKWEHLLRHLGSPAEAYRAQRGLFMPREVARMAGPALRDAGSDPFERVAAAEEECLVPPQAPADEASVARMESLQYLRAQLLRDVDALSMAHSLEVRVPFVDAPLLDALWPEAGRHPALLRGKRLLRESLLPAVRAAVGDRPKRGFTFPLREWLRAGAAGGLAGETAEAAAPWVDAAATADLGRRLAGGETHWSRPWALFVLGSLLAREARPAETSVVQ